MDSESGFSLTGDSNIAKRRKEADMLVEIDYKEKCPLYEQITARFEQLIIKGALKPGEAMPSIRSLAVELSINPNTIQKSYATLEQAGYTYSVSGRGSFVSNVEEIMPKKREEFFAEIEELIKRAGDLGISRAEIIEYIKEGVQK